MYPNELRRPTWRSGISVILAALALAAGVLLAGPHADNHDIPLALIAAILLAAAKHCPLQITPDTKVTLSTTVLFASVLLFDPAVAVAVAVGGALLAVALARPGWSHALLDTAQAALRAGAGAGLLALGGWRLAEMSRPHPEELVLLALAAGAVYTVDVVGGAMVALRTGRSPLQAWRQVAGPVTNDQPMQLGLGLLSAVVVTALPWALPLCVVPAYVAYRSCTRYCHLQRQTVAALESLADLAERQDRVLALRVRRLTPLAQDPQG